MTRYEEFAAGLNAVLKRVNELFNSDTAVFTQADLATLRRLQKEFVAEANQRDHIDTLENI